MTNEKKIEIKAVFFGGVQGVGFRSYVIGIARNFEVAGYVRNLSNSREVEVCAVGIKNEVNSFIEQIKKNSPGEIEKTEISIENNIHSYERFILRF
jgi:acylphosphatase